MVKLALRVPVRAASRWLLCHTDVSKPDKGGSKVGQPTQVLPVSIMKLTTFPANADTLVIDGG